MHLVSVIIPIYNIAEYLPRCLDSVVNQTYSNLEIIIIDDGSTDDSYVVANEYAERDSRIKILQVDHMGITRIRKRGIRTANGEYLVFVDGDDWIDSDCIEIWMQNIGNADMLLSGYITEPDKHIYQQPFEEGYYPADRMTVIRSRLFVNGVLAVSNEELISENLWNNLYKTQVLKDIIDDVPDELCVGEDKVMVCLAVLASESVYVKKAVMYHYCTRENSLSRCGISSILMDLALTYDCLRTVFEKYSERESLLSGLCQYICLWLYDGDIPYHLGYPECRKWYYPYYGRLIGKRIILYGAGEVGKSFYKQIRFHKESSIVAWVDKEPEKYKEIGAHIYPIQEITHLEYDFVIIAVYRESIAKEIMQELENMGVVRNTLLWNKTY